MFWLSTALPICYIAGLTGAFIPTQWAVLSIALPLGLWRAGSPSALHWLGVLFLCYATTAFAWSNNYYGAVLGLWQVFIWALAYRWGTTISSLAPMWKGLAIGLAISSLVAIAQRLGLHWPAIDFDTHGRQPGLLFNPVVQGMTIAFTIIGLANHRLWLHTIPLWPGLILSGSRGAYLTLAITAIARLTHWSIALAALTLGSLAFSALAGDSDIQRLQIWGITLHGLTTLGWGPGAFNDVFAIIPDASGPQLNHLEFAHNDYLQLWFDYGVGAIPLFALWACFLVNRGTLEWPTAFAFTIAATFYFPLYAPTTAFILCVLTGHFAVDWDRVWGVCLRSRLDLLQRSPLTQRLIRLVWGQPLPLEP